MTQLVYLNVLISLYEFNIWLDGYIWWKFCVNSPLRNPLTDKNADVSNTYFPRCMTSVLYFLHLKTLDILLLIINISVADDAFYK